MNNWQEIHNKRAREDLGYVSWMHPRVGPTKIVERLPQILDPKSTIFEYGVWPGKNVVYLSERWFEVRGQDVSDEMIRVFQENIRNRIDPVAIDCCPAQEYVPDREYDAFVCTHVLHFIPREDAIRVIRTMQEYTRPGWYNTLALFSDKMENARSDRFFPSYKEIVALYPDWEICREAIWGGRGVTGDEVTENIALLLRKPQ